MSQLKNIYMKLKRYCPDTEVQTHTDVRLIALPRTLQWSVKCGDCNDTRDPD